MEYIYLKEQNETQSFFKKFFKKFIEIKEDDFIIFEIPKINKKKRYLKLCKKLHKKSVKGICLGNIKDEALVYSLKQEFYIFNGESVFYKLFQQILEFFASMKQLVLSECHLVFISDDPFKVEKYIKASYKKVKRISVITNKRNFFSCLSDKCRQEYGFFMDIKTKDDKCKKYNHIYINLDKHLILQDKNIKGCYLLDIYKRYKNSFSKIIIEGNLKENTFIKENNIEININFIEFIERITKKYERKDYKIVNITKYD